MLCFVILEERKLLFSLRFLRGRDNGYHHMLKLVNIIEKDKCLCEK